MSRSPRNLRPRWLVLVFAVVSVIAGARVPAGAEVRFGEAVPALSWDASLDVLVIGYYVKWYQVQMSRDLITWRNRDIFESGFTGDYAWGDPDPARDTARFYRVLAESPALPDR